MTMESQGWVPRPTRAQAAREEWDATRPAPPAARAHRIRCPHCSAGEHGTPTEVRACAAEEADGRAAAAAEAEAEARNERFWEERGALEPEDPREIEAQMRDEDLRARAEAEYWARHGQPPF